MSLLIMQLLFLTSTTWDRDPMSRTEETVQLQRVMMWYWYSKDFSAYIINWCKKAENEKVNARRCVKRATAIWVAETQAWKTASRNNIWGVRKGNYRTREQAFDVWLNKYWTWRYNHRRPIQWVKLSNYSEWGINWINNTSSVLFNMSEF